MAKTGALNEIRRLLKAGTDQAAIRDAVRPLAKNSSSLAVLMSKARREFCIPPQLPPAKLIACQIEPDTRQILEFEAAERGIHVSELLRSLVEAIASDDLFTAILEK